MVRDVTEGEKKTLWTEPPKDYILVLIQDLNLTINLTKLNTFDLSLCLADLCYINGGWAKMQKLPYISQVHNNKILKKGVPKKCQFSF